MLTRFGALRFVLLLLLLAACASPSPSVKPIPDEPLTGLAGLRADYYANANFSGQVVSRIDRHIDFNWGQVAPAQGMMPGDFSVRWQGNLNVAQAEIYTFYLSANGQAKLFINGKAIASNVPLQLSAGSHTFKLEFVKTNLEASVKLEWSSGSLQRDIVSQKYLKPATISKADLPFANVQLNTNLLLNSNFEGGTGGWIKFGESTSFNTVTPGRDGTGSALSAASWLWIQQDLPVSNIEAGQTYTLRGYARAFDGGTCTLGFSGGSLGERLFNEFVTFRGNWEEKALSVAVPAGTVWMTVYMATSAPECQFDDLSLIAGSGVTPPPPGDVLNNGGFEADFESWGRYGGTLSIATPGQSGAKALQVSNFGWVQQDIPGIVLKNQPYTLSAFVRSSSGATCTVGWVAATATEVVLNVKLEFSNTSYEQKTLQQTVPANLNWSAVYLASGGTDCFFDALSLSLVSLSPTNFTATATSSTQINLSWSGVAGASNYILERRTGTGSFTQISTPTSTSFVDSGLQENTAYTYQLRAVNAGSASVPVTASASTPITPGTGLLGQYYNSRNFTGTPILRTDATLNFAWGTGAPIGGVASDNFSIRWTGEIRPLYNETYTFYTTSDDGSRLWINNQLIVNNWFDQGATTRSGQVTLQANQKYTIRLEYYEATGDASFRLEWQSASQPRQVVLAAQLYPSSTPPSTEALMGSWGNIQSWPLIATHMANLVDGRVLAWSSYDVDRFGGRPDLQYTQAVIFNPATGTFADTDNSQHDMFCAGIVLMPDGKVLAAGGGDGVNSRRVSTFNGTNWSRLSPDMNYGHWYGTAVAIPNGEVFMGYGRDSGNRSEVLRNGSWQALPGVSITNLTGGNNPDWYPYFQLTPRGTIFHAGRSLTTHEFNLNGTGSTSVKANRPSDVYRQWASAIMFDKGKILLTGGTPSQGTSNSSLKTGFIIDVNTDTPQFTPIAPMIYGRSHHTTLLLPNGEIMVIGGNGTGAEFADGESRLTPEIYNPSTNSWREAVAMRVPRNYHSTGTLLSDGRVLMAGGGLCGTGCAANHLDGEIYSPSYLFNSDGTPVTRPVISTVPGVIGHNQTFSVSISGSGADSISKFTLIKLSANTHAMNTDLRRLEVNFSQSGSTYTLTTEANKNVLTPGYYYLFAVNSQGVPSVAATVRVNQ